MTSGDRPIAMPEVVPEPADLLSNDPAERKESSSRRIRIIGPPAFSAGAVFSGLRALIQYSDLLYVLSLFRLNIRYKQSLLGWAWAALQPLALMAIYTFVFAHVTKVNTDETPYSVFVFAGYYREKEQCGDAALGACAGIAGRRPYGRHADVHYV